MRSIYPYYTINTDYFNTKIVFRKAKIKPPKSGCRESYRDKEPTFVDVYRYGKTSVTK